MSEEIDIDEIIVSENIRTDTGKNLIPLMESIKSNGLLQPTGVWDTEDGFVLAWGNRRLEACKKLGYRTIKCEIVPYDFTEEDFLSVNCIENLHREEVSTMELGKICTKLLDMGLNMEEISVRLSLPVSRVNRCVQIYERLPKEMKDSAGYLMNNRKRKGKIPASVAQKILNLRLSKSNQLKLFKITKDNELTIGDLNNIERLVNSGLSMERAINEIKNYKLISPKITADRKKWDETKKKYNGESTYKILVKMLKGIIPLQKDLFILTE